MTKETGRPRTLGELLDNRERFLRELHHRSSSFGVVSAVQELHLLDYLDDGPVSAQEIAALDKPEGAYVRQRKTPK